MKKNITVFLLFSLLCSISILAQKIEPIKFADFQHWIVREIPESKLIGGGTKVLYEIGPTDTVRGGKPYYNSEGSPWASSNVFASVMGVNKGSCSVFPYDRGNGNIAAQLSTKLDQIKALGLVNIEVLVGGSIFLGNMIEPVKSSTNPYSKMNMGVPFTKRPAFLQFDYKVESPDTDYRIYCSGFGKRRTIAGRDSSEVFILLQRRWEDKEGNLYAKRVGTGRERFFHTTGWTNGHRLPILYGDITSRSDYKPWMGLIPADKSYYAKNSKGKMVPVKEVGWDSPDATPTHMLIMASAACGTAYIGTPGQTLYIDNIALVY